MVKAASKRARAKACPEKRAADLRAWKAKNVERVRENNNAWAKRNPELRKEISERARAKNIDKIRARARQRHAENPQKMTDHVNAWRLKNPDLRKQQLRRQRYRRRMLKALSGMPGVKLSEWSAIDASFSGRCAYCLGEATSIDHISPLSKGGLDEPENVVPACRRCNSSKGAKSLPMWLLTSKTAQAALCGAMHSSLLSEL